MDSSILIISAITIGVAISLLVTRIRLTFVAKPPLKRMPAKPAYYFVYTMLWSGLPLLLLLALWFLYAPQHIAGLAVHHLPPQASEMQHTAMMNYLIAMAAGEMTVTPDIAAAVEVYRALYDHYAAYISAMAVIVFTLSLFFAIRAIRPDFNARTRIERFLRGVMWLAAAISVLTTVGIVMSVLLETVQFFSIIPVQDFLFGTVWSPQTALRAGQTGSSGAFGSIPLLAGTLLISVIALTVATPIGLISAIYMTEFSSAKMRAWIKPSLEILAGVPTVVYGFFAALIIAPAIQNWGEAAGLQVSSENALAAGLVMGVMLIPFVSSLSDDVLSAVPRNLYEGSLAIGVSRLETIFKIMVPAALPGIVSGILLAASRAIGETMIVVMAAGLAANLTINPLEAVTTVTVQIQALLVGDQEFDSAKTLSAFALGFTLLLITLTFNMIALHIIRKYRERYE